MTSFIGIEGALGFEFMGYFAYKCFACRQDTVFAQGRKPTDLLPIKLHGPAEGDGCQLLRALARWWVGLRINRG